MLDIKNFTIPKTEEERRKLETKMLNELKPFFPLLRTINIYEFSGWYITFAFVCDWTISKRKIVSKIEETYNIKYSFTESCPITYEDSHIFKLFLM